GALLITTKRGTNSGKPTIVYQNSFQFEKVAFYPKLQTTFGLNGGEGAATGYQDPITNAPLYVPYENQEYGPRYDGSTVLLGAPLDSLNGTQLKALYKAYPTSPIKAFFQTGITEQNDISFSQGDAQNSVFISAQNATRTTIVPKDKNIKNAFSLRGHRTYGIFSVDYSLGYTKTDISTYGQSYVTAFAEPSLYGAVLQLPAFLNIKAYQNPDLDYTNPSNYYDAYAINPYWIIDHTRKNTSRDILLANVNFKLDPTKWLSASYRISDNTGIGQERITQQEVDFSTYSIKDPLGASNVQSGFGTGKSPGLVADIFQYGDGSFNNSPDAGYGRIQGDALLDFHHTFFHDFKTNLLLGNTVWQQNQKFMSTGSNNLLLKDFYNINTIGGLVNASEFSQTIRQIAYYGDFNVSYRGFLTLDATLRNEQDSRLSKAERSFSYPSGKLAFIPTQAIPVLRNSKILNYWKLYGSVSRVGNIDINPYEIQNIYTLTPGFPYGSLGGLNSGTTNFSPTLKPELTTEIELGTELSFFNDRLGLNFTYYNQHDKNQTVPVATTIATGFSTSIINVGETQSKGYEIQLTGDLLTKANNKFLLRVGANFSDNDSKVISLLPGVSQLSLGNNNFAIVGQPFPVLFTSDFVRDPKGRVVVDANSGDPSKSLTLTNYGRTTPKYNLGVNLTLSYKFISLYALAEYRGGYVVDNNLGQSLDFTGAGFITAEAGRQIFVYPNSSIQTAPGVFVPNTNVTVKDGNYDFWQKSAYSDVNGAVVSSGAFWKLREVSLNFDLNQFIDKSKFIKGAMFSLTGRNLFIWVPKSNPYTDPEFSNANPFSSARGLNDDNITPGTRVFGANLKLTF
ncbi:MAG: TonB-dependent receptor domain-containing protein, partial [Mucilaginibacter sp.]